jgi:phosphoesterase RecJ-like protein
MSDNCRKILKFLEQKDNFLITSHINADGDAYASMLALAYFFDNLKKDYKIIIDDEKLEIKYEFLWGFNKIIPFSNNMDFIFEAAVVLDVPSIKRIGRPAQFLPSADNCVIIDHHPEEDIFAKYRYIDTNASSTSRLVYYLLSLSPLKMKDELANLIFSGIMYDTGRFSFSNTTQEDFFVASELLKNKVVPSKISNKLFFDNSYEAMKIIGYGLANLESLLDGKLAIIYLPRKIMDENYSSEIEELANYSVSVKGVEVGLFIREVEPNFFKVSFRSKGRINVNHIAKAFGGGGHLHAAGCRYKGNYEDFKKELVKETKKLL